MCVCVCAKRLVVIVEPCKSSWIDDGIAILLVSTQGQELGHFDLEDPRAFPVLPFAA